MKVGERLRILRNRRGWTQTKLSDMSDVTQTTISTIEQGATPNVEIANKLALALNVPIESLVRGEDSSERVFKVK